MGLAEFLNATTSSGTIDPPRFHLVAELSGDGTLICNPNLQKLLSKSEGLEIVIVSTVEDQILGKPRMIDHVQYSLFSEQEKYKNWNSVDIWKTWRKSPQEHFPRLGTGSAPSELQGKNGILLQAKPYIGPSSWQRHCGLPMNKAVFLMTIWIGAPEYLDDPGFTKLADFLYFASSSVIHATFDPNQLQCTKRFLWYSSISNAYQEHAKVFKQICFLFFNWPYDENNQDLKILGHIRTSDFKKWVETSPIVAACCQVSQKFHSPSFYCFNALGQQGLDVRALKNILASEAYGFEVRREWLSTKLRQDDKFEDLVQKIVHQLNQHYYSPADPLWVPPIPAGSPKRSDTSTLNLQSKTTQVITRASDNSQVQARAQRAREIAVAVGKYQHYFEKLFMENPTTDVVKLGELHSLAAIEVCEDFVDSNDINLAIQKDWSRTTRCLTELDNKLADLEPTFTFLLMSHDATRQKLCDFLKAADKDLQDFCLTPGDNEKVLVYYVSTHGKPVLEKMLLIVETLTAPEKVLTPVNGYLRDKTITDARREAISEFQDPVSTLDSTAVFVLENKFKDIEFQNECLKRKAVVLSGKAHQDALAEYRKAMDRLLEKAVYSRKSLIETHERVIEAVFQTFSSEEFQNEIWQNMAVRLKGEMRAQFPTAVERNWINAKAAYRRYKEVMSSAFATYKTSLIEACEVARRAAMATYFEKVAGEPQNWISQWQIDLSDRIWRESPAAQQALADHEAATATSGGSALKLRLRSTAAVGTLVNADAEAIANLEESKLKPLLRSCVEEMEVKFSHSHAELGRYEEFTIPRALKTAKKVLELQDPSGPDKLKQVLANLNRWRPSLNLYELNF